MTFASAALNLASIYLLMTDLLYANKDLKFLDTVVKNEPRNVCYWLNADKLTINAKKSNFVIFKPAQTRIYHEPCIKILDINNGFVLLECKDHVKF